MSDMAIDIVLLPDPHVRACALRINRLLVEQFQSEIQLDPKRCLPHVSLAMGCLKQENLGGLVSELESIVKASNLGAIEISGINVHHHGDRVVSHLSLQPASALQALHEDVMKTSSPYLHAEPTSSMFHVPSIADSTLSWVRHYAQKAAFENFDPHITLGYGDPGEQSIAEKMVPECVAICHLGNHCTCRHILAQVDLA